MKRNNKGFTAVEFTTTLSIFGILLLICGGWAAIFMGNFWFTESGLLKKIRLQEAAAVRIVDTNRDVFGYSDIVIQNADGQTSNWLLDTNILFNYEVKPNPNH